PSCVLPVRRATAPATSASIEVGQMSADPSLTVFSIQTRLASWKASPTKKRLTHTLASVTVIARDDPRGRLPRRPDCRSIEPTPPPPAGPYLPTIRLIHRPG